MRCFPALAAFLLLSGSARAADEALLRLLPRAPMLVAGLDVQRARQSDFGRRILKEIVEEDAAFARLAQSGPFQITRDLREAMVGSAGLGEQTRSVLLLRGRFDTARTGQFLAEYSGSSSLHKDVLIWKGRDAQSPDAFAFLDGSLAVFGDESLVRQVIDRRAAGAASLDAGIRERITEWSRRGDAWFISRAPLGAMDREGGGLAPPGLVLDSIREMNLAVRFGEPVALEGDLTMRSAVEAKALSGLIQLMLPLLRLRAGQQEAADMAKLVDSVRLNAEGDRIRFSAKLTEDQLRQLHKNAGAEP
jgi:hypothetical protein